MKRRLLPQRLALPSAREAHGGDVDGRESGEQGIYLSLHVVVGRNDVEEILDDAKIEIDAEGIGRQCNTGHIDRDAELRRCCRWWRSRMVTGFIGHQIRMWR